MKQGRYQAGASVIYETLDNETVLINLDTGRYYSLNACGTLIWEGLMGERDAEEIAKVFARRDEAEGERIWGAVATFLEELRAEELIVEGSVRAGQNGTRGADGFEGEIKRRDAVFEAPRLEKFSDMEQLLPLDPIHEVSEQGWPHRGGQEDEA